MNVLTYLYATKLLYSKKVDTLVIISELKLDRLVISVMAHKVHDIVTKYEANNIDHKTTKQTKSFLSFSLFLFIKKENYNNY